MSLVKNPLRAIFWKMLFMINDLRPTVTFLVYNVIFYESLICPTRKTI